MSTYQKAYNIIKIEPITPVEKLKLKNRSNHDNLKKNNETNRKSFNDIFTEELKKKLKQNNMIKNIKQSNHNIDNLLDIKQFVKRNNIVVNHLVKLKKKKEK